MPFHVPEAARVLTGRFGSSARDGCNGLFVLRGPDPDRARLQIISSDGGGWEHVSVSRRDVVPTWDDMDFVKRLFWSDDQAVMQLHPPRAEWVNTHARCLHLWRPTTPGVEIPRPPSLMVGIPGVELTR
jgi:hypothetical protein